MRGFIGMVSLAIWMMVSPTVVMAQMETISVTVSFRERIALPPGAQLDLRIRDVAQPHGPVGPVAAQRFAMTGVPMTVSLGYDPRIVADGGLLDVAAAIVTPDGQQMFRATTTVAVADGATPLAVDMVLAMLPEADATSAVPRRLSGVSWTVTEVLGAPWPSGDRGTLVVDDEMNFSIFGGCNRYMGQIAPLGRGLVFPANMAGTMMACPDEIEAQERRFLAALMQVSDYVRYGAGLIMTDAFGRGVVHFVPTPE